MSSNRNFELYCPTNRLEIAAELVSSVAPVEITIVDGSGASSFASLCNAIIRGSNCDYVLIANDKSRPTSDDVEKTLALLGDGYGLVGLYRMGFFGISKSAFDYVGGFDEGFSDGGFEDNDIYLRFKYHDIGVYLSEEISYLKGKRSSWAQIESRKHFFNKYSFGVLSKAIFIEPQFFHVPNQRSRPALRDWGQSVLGVIPLETMNSGFEGFLRDGWFVEKVDRKAINIYFKRIARALSNILLLNVPPLLEWKRYCPSKGLWLRRGSRASA